MACEDAWYREKMINDQTMNDRELTKIQQDENQDTNAMKDGSEDVQMTQDRQGGSLLKNRNYGVQNSA